MSDAGLSFTAGPRLNTGLPSRILVGTNVRTIQRVLTVAVSMTIGVLLLSPSAASAHTGFESSDPADGSTVNGVVEQITLQFTGAAEPTGEGFVVLDPNGIVRTPDLVTADAERQAWTLSFDPPLTSGAVGIRWTVQAQDAHPIDGSFRFTVAAPSREPSTEGDLGMSDGSDDSEIPSAGAPASDQPEDADAAAGATPDSNLADSGNDDLGIEPEPTTIDEFLTQPTIATANTRAISTVGRLFTMIGAMLGIGGLAFAAAVIRDHRRDTISVLKAVRYSGAAVVVGAIIDLIARLAIANNGWMSFWSASALESVAPSAFGVATGLRIAAGVLLYVAATLAANGLTGAVPTARSEGVLVAPAGPSLQEGAHDTDTLTAEPAATAAVHANAKPAEGISVTPGLAIASLVLMTSFTFDGHTVTAGNRWLTGAVDVVHVMAGSIWAGGVAALAIVLWQRRRHLEQLKTLELAVRFSTIAGAAVAAAGVAGTILAVIILDSVSEIWSTPWGLSLVAKFVAVLAAASLGAYNHFVVIPWMEAQPSEDRRSVRLRNTVTGEAALLVVVLTMTAVLVGAAS